MASPAGMTEEERITWLARQGPALVGAALRGEVPTAVAATSSSVRRRQVGVAKPSVPVSRKRNTVRYFKFEGSDSSDDEDVETVLRRTVGSGGGGEGGGSRGGGGGGGAGSDGDSDIGRRARVQRLSVARAVILRGGGTKPDLSTIREANRSMRDLARASAAAASAPEASRQRTVYSSYVTSAAASSLNVYRETLKSLVLADAVPHEASEALAEFQKLYRLGVYQHWLVMRDMGLDERCLDSLLAKWGKVPAAVDGKVLLATSRRTSLVDTDTGAAPCPLDFYREALANAHAKCPTALSVARYHSLMKLRKDLDISGPDHVRIVRQLRLGYHWVDLATVVSDAKSASNLAETGKYLLRGASSVGPVPTPAPASIVQRGMLYKKQRHFGRWVPRWYVLLSNMSLLACKSRKHENKPKYIIDLTTCSVDPLLIWIGSSGADADEEYFAFSISGPSMHRTLVLGSEFASERRTWLAAIMG